MKFYTLIFLSFAAFSCSEQPKKEKKVTESEQKATSNSTTNDGEKEVVQFWQLMSEGKVEDSIRLANSLITEVTGGADHFHKPLFKQEGIKESFLVRKSFNEVDAFFWNQAQFFKSFSKDAFISPKGPIEALYDKVIENLVSKSEVEDVGAYPIHIWERGFGACDRQAWVMCEMVYQLGGKASVVYLRHPETKVSPHTICEVVYNNKHYIIDSLYRKFLANTRFTDLTPEKVKQVWAENSELHNTFEQAVRLIPSMPVDYTERNQRLNARLGNIIRFGEPPQNRYHYWKGIYPDMDTRFWEYPVRILKNTKFYQDAEK